MSKRFKGKTCVYCCKDGASSTEDHVLARQFALERHRANLPKVPACGGCNRIKAELEHHLATVLPFGGRHADAKENLESMVPKRLARNARLNREIAHTLKPRWVMEPSGLLVRRSAVHIDAEILDRWLIMVVQGLIWHHWMVVAGDDYTKEVLMLSDQNRHLFAPFFRMTGELVEGTSIGGGALSYEAIGVSEQLPVSAWHLFVYGGIELAGDDPCARTRDFFVIVRPHRDIEVQAATP